MVFHLACRANFDVLGGIPPVVAGPWRQHALAHLIAGAQTLQMFPVAVGFYKPEKSYCPQL